MALIVCTLACGSTERKQEPGIVNTTRRVTPVGRMIRWVTARPARLITFSFLLVILTGALLLTLPIASQDGRSVGFLRALFTATSATCVTGLVVVDTATYWTLFGQIVVLALIQIGGLSIVTITTFFFALMRRKMGIKTLILIQESTGSFDFADVLKLVRKIIAVTFSIEMLGFVVLATQYVPVLGWKTGLWKSFFQGVSAFCNAGFDLMGHYSGPFSSLTAWNGRPLVTVTTALLLIFGGLGFIVWADLLNAARTKSALNFHTRMVLWMTGLLLVGGAVFFYVVERDNHGFQSLGNLPAWQQPFAAFFQSATPRTAGFNSIDQYSLRPGSKFVTIILMFIGAAPGGTGGGIKVTTFGVLMFAILSELHGSDGVVMGRRRISQETVMRSLTIAGLALLLVMGVTMFLTFTEETRLLSHLYAPVQTPLTHLSFVDLFFEVTSAFGTVGLTSAQTPTLHPASWAALIPVMFIGRVGPASFALGLAIRARLGSDKVLPEGKVLVG